MTRSKTIALPPPASGLGWLRDPTRPSHKWGMAATVSLSGFLVSMSQMAVQVALMQNGLGNTLGLALMTTVLQNRLTYHSSLLDQQQAFSPLSWGDMLAPVRALVRQTGAVGPLGDTQVLALLHQHLEQQAAVASYQDCFMLVTLLGLASMPLVLLLRKPET